MSSQTLYPKSVEVLKHVLSEKNYKDIEKYLHEYNGTADSVKPVAKYITIYWIGRVADRMILRTEGEDDIILSEVGGEAVPTIIFRKLKAVYLRDFMKLVRVQWSRHSESIKESIKNVYGDNYDFLTGCSIAVGIAGEEKGVLHGRCMKCPVDVLMGATSGEAKYNLVSRFVGDAAYALTPSFERRTGNSIDEVTHTTIMLTGGESEEVRRTGGLFSETFVEPGTLFVGKIVLPMISQPELVHVLWLLAHVKRIGARTSIQGTLEVYPVAMVGDLFEVGTAYEVAEKLRGKKNIEEVRRGILDYLNNEAKFVTSSSLVEFTPDVISKLRNINILEQNLMLELWSNAKRYVEGILKYIQAR